MATVLKRYKGSANEYTDIATRGNEAIGLGLQYAVHPESGTGHILVRFVAHSDTGQFEPFTHFHPRQSARFRDFGTDKSFNGVRLNKLAIPVFSPAPILNDVVLFGDKLGVWALLADWITDQLVADGFVPTVPSILEHIRAELQGISVPFESVKMVISLPDLVAEKKSAVAYTPHSYKSHNDGDEDADDGDEDEPNEDEEDDDGDTIN